VTWLSAISVADALDREHVQNVRDLEIEVDDGQMEVELRLVRARTLGARSEEDTVQRPSTSRSRSPTRR
jgi:hypothetical protein